jgi:hypothetical protein
MSTSICENTFYLIVASLVITGFSLVDEIVARALDDLRGCLLCCIVRAIGRRERFRDYEPRGQRQ